MLIGIDIGDRNRRLSEYSVFQAEILAGCGELGLNKVSGWFDRETNYFV